MKKTLLQRANVRVTISGDLSSSELESLTYEVQETLRAIDNLRFFESENKQGSESSKFERKGKPVRKRSSESKISQEKRRRAHQ